jgi:hypothetical protein
MRPMKARAVAVALWVLAAAGGLVIVATAIIGMDPAAGDVVVALIMFALIAFDALVCTTVGVLIVMRRPGNLVGWTLAALGVGLVLTFAGFGSAGVRAEQVGPDDTLAGLFLWIGVVAFNPTMALVGLVMLLFPDGHLPSPRWKGPIGTLAVMIVAATLVIAIKPGEFDPSLPANPFGLHHPLVEVLAPVALAIASAGSLGSILIGAVAVGSRFLRARGDTREQLKWFLGAVALVALSIVPGIVVTQAPWSTTTDSGSQEFGLFDIVGSASLALLPLSIGVAVLRYRLYDIDRLISRTLSWALVTVVLLAVFGTGILAIQGALSGVTNGETLAVAVSTLAAVALFQPVRRRIQGIVDRRFDRARYDAGIVIEAMAERLRDPSELSALGIEIVRVATETVRPASAAVWIRAPAGRRAHDASSSITPSVSPRAT